MSNTGTVHIALKIDEKGSVKVLQNVGKESTEAGRKGKRAFDDMDRSAKNFTGSAKEGTNTLLKMGAGILGVTIGVQALKSGITALNKELWDAGTSYGRTVTALDEITGSSKDAAMQIDYLRGVAEKYGQNLYDILPAYKSFLAATSSSGMSLDNTRIIFEGATKAVASLGLGSSEAQRLLYSLQQMVSKGMAGIAEEVNQQMGEVLPGAFGMFADALGVSQVKLRDMMEQGDLTLDHLVKFGAYMGQTFSGQINEAVAAQNRYNQQMQDLKTLMANSGYLDAATRGLKLMTDVLKDPSVQENLTGIVEAVSDWFIKNEDLIRQDIPVYIGNVKTSAEDLFTVVSYIKSIYDSIPAEITGPLGLGIVGTVLFGGAAGKFIGMMAAIDQGMSKLDMGLGDLWRKTIGMIEGLQKFGKLTQEIVDGQRDWNTGKLIDDTSAGVTKMINMGDRLIDTTENQSAAQIKLNKTLNDAPEASNKAKKALQDYQKAMADVSDEYAKLTLSAEAYDKIKIDKWYEAEAKALGGVTPKLKEVYDLMLKKNVAKHEEIALEKAYQDMKEATDANYKTSMAAVYDDIDIEGPKYQAEVIKAEYAAMQKAKEDADRHSQKLYEESLKKQEDALNDFSGKVQDYTAEIIANWDNMGDTLVNIMKRTAAEMLAALVSQQFIVPITMQIGSALGLNWNGVSFGNMLSGISGLSGGSAGASSGGGTSPLSLLSTGKSAYSTLTGGIGNMFTQGPLAKIGSSIFGNTAWFGQTGGTSSSAFGYAANYSAVTGGNGVASSGISGALGSAASVLGSAVTGFMIGKMISGGYSALGGQSGNLATGIGTAVGSLFGPVGALIGGALGGLVNRAFGHKAPEVTGSGITGTFSTDNANIQNYQTWTAKGGWFRSDKHGINYSAISSELDQFLDASLVSVTTTTKAYAEALGLNASRINGITQSINISMAGLSDEQKEKALQDALTGFGNLLASQYTEISAYVRAGESYTDTLSRLAGSLLAVNAAFEMLDVSLIQTSVYGGNTASVLVDLFGGIDAFNQSVNAYYDRFYTASEKSQYSVKILSDAFDSMGMSIPPSLEQYRKLVEAQNLYTQSGRETYAALIAMAPAFAEVTGALLEPFMEVSDPFAQFAGQFKDWIDYLRESGATLVDITEAERQRNLALGLQLTGLNVNSVGQSLLASATGGADFAAQINAIVGSTVASTFANSISNKVMGTLVAGFEEEIGAEFGRLGYNVGSLFERLPEMMAAFQDQISPTSQALDDFAAKWQEMFGEQIDTTAELAASEEALQRAREQAQESIQNLIDSLNTGDLAPVQSMEFFTRRYGQLFADATNAAGTEEYGDKVGNLTNFIPEMLKFAMAYGGNYNALYASVMQDLKSLGGGVPQFESGGYHSGGLAIVHGQELISSGPATISNKSDTLRMITDAVRDAVGGNAGSTGTGTVNLEVHLRVGTHEFRSLVMEAIKVDPETQRQVRRVANG